MHGRSKSLNVLVHEESLSLLDEKAFTDSDNDSEYSQHATQRLSSTLSRLTAHARDIPSSLSFNRRVILRILTALLPSFLQPRTGAAHSRVERSNQTAYLDGIRGLAALFVFFCHYSYTSYIITLGFGHGMSGENSNFLQLPIVRLLYSGPPMVCLFFVISGYALSYKPLKQMRSQTWEALFTTMTSAIFRRGLRLFLPTFASTFMVAVLLQLGAYEGNRTFATEKGLLRNVLEHHPAPQLTSSAQSRDWTRHMFNFIHVWGWEPFGGSTGYDVHLWTIPVEFRCSLVLFLALIGLARLRPWLRLGGLLLISWFTYANNQWGMVLFFAGMFLAETDLIIQARTSRRSANQPFQGLGSSRAYKVFWTINAVLAMYLMSQPDEQSETTPGWVWLSSLIPTWFEDKYRYWQCAGSILFILSCARVRYLQRPFNLAPIQYLGKTCYALYLMHGPVMHTIGYAVERWAWGITGSATGFQYNMGFVLGALINVPVVIWAADVFWRAIDQPCVRFARWLETKCIVPL